MGFLCTILSVAIGSSYRLVWMGPTCESMEPNVSFVQFLIAFVRPFSKLIDKRILISLFWGTSILNLII